MNISIQVFMWKYVLISFGYIPRSGIAGSCGRYMLNILRNCQGISKVTAPFHSLQQ